MKISRKAKKSIKNAIIQGIINLVKSSTTIMLGDQYDKEFDGSKASDIWGTKGYFVNELKPKMTAAGFNVVSQHRVGCRVSLATRVSGNVPQVMEKPPVPAMGNMVQFQQNEVMERTLWGYRKYDAFNMETVPGMKLTDIYQSAGFNVDIYEPKQIKNLPKMFSAIKSTTKTILRGVIDMAGKQYYAYLRITTAGRVVVYHPQLA